MKIEVQIQKRVTIEYQNTAEGKKGALEYLASEYGWENCRIVRSGPKMLGNHTVDPSIGLMIIDVDTNNAPG